jgi:hypothetical protein
VVTKYLCSISKYGKDACLTLTTNYEWWKTDANQSDAGIVYKVTTTTSGSSPKVTYFDAFNRKTKELVF